jgi:hypothetical protein
MRRLIIGLTLALALVIPPAARQAVARVNPSAAQQAVGALTIATFYLTTNAAYDVWLPQAAPPAPPRVATFPTTIQGLAYYFAFKGAAKATRYQVNVRDHSGALVYVGVAYSLGTVSTGSAMASFRHRFPPGTYTAHLRINGHPIRSTSFRMARTVPIPTISTFYASTRQAFAQWDRTSALPRVSTFPAHTRAVGYYFEYTGGAGAASSQVYIRAQNGTIVVSNPVLRLPRTSHQAAGSLTAPRTGGYAAGTYAIHLLLNGRPVRTSAIFTVRPPARAVPPTSRPPTATPTPPA